MKDGGGNGQPRKVFIFMIIVVQRELVEPPVWTAKAWIVCFAQVRVCWTCMSRAIYHGPSR